MVSEPGLSLLYRLIIFSLWGVINLVGIEDETSVRDRHSKGFCQTVLNGWDVLKSSGELSCLKFLERSTEMVNVLL